MILFTEEQISQWFNLMLITKGVEQEEKHHPEGDVWNHSFQALGIAMRETKDTDLIIAALFHDIGKSVITHGHEKESVRMMEDEISPKSLWLIQHHMRSRLFLSGEMNKHSKVRELLDNPFFPQLMHLRRIDAKARKPNRKYWIEPIDLADRLNKCVEEHFEHNKNRAKLRRDIANAH